MTTQFKTGCKAPLHVRFGAVPKWSDKNPVLSESECQDHDNLAQFCEPSKAQNYNNCTNASLAWIVQTAFKQAGIACPDLSRSFAYALCNGGVDQGAMCRDVMSVAMTKGLPPEMLCPEDHIYLPRGGWPTSLLKAAMQWELLEVYQCMDWPDVRSALAREFLVYHGFSLGGDDRHCPFFDTGSNGKPPTWDGRLSNGHAMGSRGLTRKFGDLRTVTPNTWGTTFGDGGVCYIDQSYFNGGSGNYLNMEAFAIRFAKIATPLPVAS